MGSPNADDFRYDLWYVADFPLTSGLENWRRDERDGHLADFLDTMEAHIRAFGVRYPIGVHIRASGVEVRPGKCRVTALRRLGRDTCPAIVADYTRPGTRPTGWVRLPHSAEFIQSRFFAGSDTTVEVSRRFFSLKKNDVVRRPGVEDEFSKELRLIGK